MNKKRRRSGFIGMLVVVLLAGLLVGGEAEAVKIRWATIAGFYTDWAKEVIKDFEKQNTDIDVEVVDIDFGVLYEKEGIELVGKTGAYDLITTESCWKPEWAHAGWLFPLDDFIAKTPREELDMKDISPALVKLACSYKGKVYALPYYTYTQGMFYRKDLFEDPLEKAAFFKKYGYPLAVPKTWEQHRDIAEFFTRKPGEKLKGKTLDKPFYGVGMMAGRFPQIQDEWMSILWSWGGEIIDEEGDIVVNNPIAQKALLHYKNMLKFAPPGASTSAYDEVVAQMKENMIAMTMGFYLDQAANIIKVEETVPGAVIGAAPAPGWTAYIGAFGIGISMDSRHKEEAWKFLKFISSKKAQTEFALGGGTTCLMSVLKDPEIQAHRKTCWHYKTLAEILDYHEKHNITHPFFDSPVAGKIYEELMIKINEGAMGTKPVKQALDELAATIERLRAQVR